MRGFGLGFVGDAGGQDKDADIGGFREDVDGPLALPDLNDGDADHDLEIETGELFVVGGAVAGELEMVPMELSSIR